MMNAKEILNSELKLIMNYLLNDKLECEVEWPNFRNVKAKIIGINLRNSYKQIHVKILEDLYKEEYYMVDHSFVEGLQTMKKKKIKFNEEWVNADMIKFK